MKKRILLNVVCVVLVCCHIAGHWPHRRFWQVGGESATVITPYNFGDDEGVDS